MAISEDFHDRLKQLISESEHKHTELRARIGVSSTAFTNAVVYGILPTPKTLVKFADYFEVSLPYLLGKTEENDYFPADHSATFHERFTALCMEKGVTYYRVGADCGFDKSLIPRWMSKGFFPSLGILEELCDYFSVSPDYLLGRSEYKN